MNLSASTITEDLQRLRKARILFSHHSVGRNLLTGIARLDAEVAGEPLRVLDERAAKTSVGPAWIDVSGGQNGAPKTKIDFFVSTLRELGDAKPELAFMKLCYVDFNPNTNVDELFAYYQQAVTTLQRELPGLRLAHLTVPLTSQPTDLKSRAYRMLGRPVWEDSANEKRGEFNQRLRKTFASAPVFDLARAESTRADGSREQFTQGGQQHESLVPAYTDDGGHLNDAGQRAIAPQLVHFLATTLATAR